MGFDESGLERDTEMMYRSLKHNIVPFLLYIKRFFRNASEEPFF